MHHNALYEEPKQRVPEVLVSPRSCLSRHPVVELLLLLLVLVLVVLRDCRPRSCGRSARAPPWKSVGGGGGFGFGFDAMRAMRKP